MSKHTRGLSKSFFDSLSTGFLKELGVEVTRDSDLNLEIRENFISIYYKGHSLLKLAEIGPDQYRTEIDGLFTRGLTLPSLCVDADSTHRFVQCVPKLKRNMATCGRLKLECEYQQMLIRANNYEPRNNSDYFIIDREYMVGRSGLVDLMGFFWRGGGRRKRSQRVPLCLMETKFATNPDISQVHGQLQRYYDAIAPRAGEIAQELENLFRQKIDLGLYKQEAGRIDALRTLSFSKDVSQFQFVLILVDYNPHSSKLQLDSLRNLPFASQIRVFRTGFAMWQQNVQMLLSS